MAIRAHQTNVVGRVVVPVSVLVFKLKNNALPHPFGYSASCARVSISYFQKTLKRTRVHPERCASFNPLSIRLSSIVGCAAFIGAEHMLVSAPLAYGFLPTTHAGKHFDGLWLSAQVRGPDRCDHLPVYVCFSNFSEIFYEVSLLVSVNVADITSWPTPMVIEPHQSVYYIPNAVIFNRDISVLRQGAGALTGSVAASITPYQSAVDEIIAERVSNLFDGQIRYTFETHSAAPANQSRCTTVVLAGLEIVHSLSCPVYCANGFANDATSEGISRVNSGSELEAVTSSEFDAEAVGQTRRSAPDAVVWTCLTSGFELVAAPTPWPALDAAARRPVSFRRVWLMLSITVASHWPQKNSPSHSTSAGRLQKVQTLFVATDVWLTVND